jgi:integrase
MENVAKNHNMIRVGDRWHYRRRVPQDLLSTFDGKEVIKLSLKTNDVKIARQLRDLEEVKWNSRFHQLRNKGSLIAEAKISLLGSEETKQLIRELVTEELAGFRQAMETGSPPTSEERRDIEHEQRADLLGLKSGDSKADEWLSHAWLRVVKRAESSNRTPQATEPNIAFLTRALVEIANMKVREVNLDYSRKFIDPDFNPATKAEFSFGELVKDHLAHYNQTAKLNERTEKAIDKVEQNIGLVLELVGTDTPISAIDFDFIEKLKLKLSRVPTNYKKIYVGKSLDEAIELAEASGATRLSHITQSQYLRALSNVLKRGKSKKWVSELPHDLKPITEDKVAAKDKRQSFTTDQLKSFFAGPFYTAAINGDPTVKDRPDYAWRFWLPILTLYSGMRGNEICQMLTTDVKQTPAGTWYFHITDETDESNSVSNSLLAKSIKTPTSKRKIPIHSLVQSLGFLDFVARRKAMSGVDRIFVGIKPDKYGNLFSYPSKRFNEQFLLSEMTPKRSKRQSFHSLRHTWRDAMRQTNASPDTLQALGAWDQADLTSANYGELSQPDHQKQFIEAVKFGDLDLLALATISWKND